MRSPTTRLIPAASATATPVLRMNIVDVWLYLVTMSPGACAPTSSGARTGPVRMLGNTGNLGLANHGIPPEKQTWAARQIDYDGSARDTTLDWAELRRCVSGSDARLLLRTSALDLAVRENFVIFDLVVLKGYVDRDRAVLLYPATDDSGSGLAAPGIRASQCYTPTREHCTRVEMNVNGALARSGGRRLSFAMVVLECVLEEVRIAALAHFATVLRRPIGMQQRNFLNLSEPSS